MLLSQEDRDEIRDDLLDLGTAAFVAIQDGRIDETEWVSLLTKLAEVPPTKTLIGAAVGELADLFYRDDGELRLAIEELTTEEIPDAEQDGDDRKVKRLRRKLVRLEAKLAKRQGEA